MKNSQLMLILAVIGAAGAAFYFWNSKKPGSAAGTVATKAAAPVAQDNTNKYLDLASQILANF